MDENPMKKPLVTLPRLKHWGFYAVIRIFFFLLHRRTPVGLVVADQTSMNFPISTSVNSALPMPIFCSKGTKIGLGFHLVFVKACKNFIDFTQDKKNRYSVFESWNSISISKNHKDRFWKSIVYIIRQSELKFLFGEKVKKDSGIRFIPVLKPLGFLSPYL